MLPSAPALVGFLLAVLPLVVTPGASFALASRATVRGDLRGLAQVITGTGLGIVTHAFLAGMGLSALVMASAQAFAVVRTVGALYLLALGISMIAGVVRGGPRPTKPARRRLGVGAAYLANVLNPKAAGVYLTLAPQFLTWQTANQAGMVALDLVHVFAMAVWLIVWGSVLARQAPATGRRLALAAGVGGGGLLVVTGVRTLIDR